MSSTFTKQHGNHNHDCQTFYKIMFPTKKVLILNSLIVFIYCMYQVSHLNDSEKTRIHSSVILSGQKPMKYSITGKHS